MQKMISTPFATYATSVPEALEKADLSAALAALDKQDRVVIKPNLVNSSTFPVTTHPDCVAAVVEYVRASCSAEIVIAEGCGSSSQETGQVFRALGYADLADKHGLDLIDLNHAPTREVTVPEALEWPSLHLPEIILDSFVLSVPVLKAHSLADVTGTIKNMMGCLPPSHYAGVHGSWKKARFHGAMQQSLLDLRRVCLPSFSLVDASVGLADFHLGGATCTPPVGLLLAGTDALALDRECARLLGRNWRTIGHLAD